MDLIINLDFIPTNLDNEPVMATTLAKEIGRLLCESTGTGNALIKTMMGLELFNHGTATFKDVDTQQTKDMITYFKELCETYPTWSNKTKSEILKQF
jgi:DNA-binding ferritin-like protein (Dps family)